MKSILRTTACLGLMMLINICYAGNIYASNPDYNKQTDVIMKPSDLGCITNQLSAKVGFKNGLLIKSKMFVFYINRKQKHVLFVSNKLKKIN